VLRGVVYVDSHHGDLAEYTTSIKPLSVDLKDGHARDLIAL